MSRCYCCDCMFKRNPGVRTLPDGTKIEEDMCPDCRDKSIHPVDDRGFAFDEITEFDFIFAPSGVTPVKKNREYD